MLRLLTYLALVCCILLTAIGAAFSRAWGWSEYTSDELYVVYQQQGEGLPQFFMVDADADSPPVSLHWQEGNLTVLACSPDGQTLALLGASGQLAVLNRAGVLYQRALGSGYDGVYAANNGRVAVFKETYGLALIVDGQGSHAPIPPEHIAFNPIEITSSGAALWSHTGTGGIYLMSPNGDNLMRLPQGTSAPVWLASEQLFLFRDTNYVNVWDAGIVDAASRMVVGLRDSNILLYGILSPDATEEVMPLDDPEKPQDQLYVIDPFTRRSMRQLTYDEGIRHTPLCFLTFKPPMLTEN
jgi:hypothetical protein